MSARGLTRGGGCGILWVLRPECSHLPTTYSFAVPVPLATLLGRSTCDATGTAPYTEVPSRSCNSRGRGHAGRTCMSAQHYTTPRLRAQQRPR